jgi:hypothetical protein
MVMCFFDAYVGIEVEKAVLEVQPILRGGNNYDFLGQGGIPCIFFGPFFGKIERRN